MVPGSILAITVFFAALVAGAVPGHVHDRDTCQLALRHVYPAARRLDPALHRLVSPGRSSFPDPPITPSCTQVMPTPAPVGGARG
jgi:hypothetical protein